MTNRKRPEQTPNQRRLADRDEAARLLRSNGWSFPKIARALNVSLGTAHRIATGDES